MSISSLTVGMEKVRTMAMFGGGAVYRNELTLTYSVFLEREPSL
jgi:hypothetical protein